MDALYVEYGTNGVGSVHVRHKVVRLASPLAEGWKKTAAYQSGYR